MHYLENVTFSIGILNRYYRPHRDRARNRGKRTKKQSEAPQKLRDR